MEEIKMIIEEIKELEQAWSKLHKFKRKLLTSEHYNSKLYFMAVKAEEAARALRMPTNWGRR